MTTRQKQYHWLIGSLCIWLLCAGVAQQPAPTRKAQAKARSGAATHHPTANIVAKTKSVNTVPDATTAINAGGEVVDTESGLAMDKDLLLVKDQCTACHSSRLILQSHFDREKWVERIRWMQRTQKLWDLGDTEPVVLAYLTKYYGPLKTPFDGRRLPLAAPTWYKSSK